MKRLILVLILAFPLSLQAQSPGYQGKHFILSYSPDINLTNYFLGVFNPIPHENVFGLFLRHNIMAEYVVNRTLSIGLEYTFLNTDLGITENDSYQYIMKLNSGQFGFNFIFYTGENNPVAPVGNYLKFKFFVNNYSANVVSPVPNPIPPNAPNPQSVTGQNFGIGFGFGHNHVVANRLIITYGGSIDYNIDNTQNTTVLNQRAYEHFVGAYLLPSLRFGVGGLLF